MAIRTGIGHGQPYIRLYLVRPRGYLRRALDAGVSGYLLKDAPAATLASAILRIRAGAGVIDPEPAAEA